MSGNEEKQIMEIVQKKRGSKSASIEATTTARRDEISQVIAESFQYFNNRIVETDEECAERLNGYFVQCNETGQIPTVEDMCLCLGAVRSTVWNWEQGSLGTVRMNMIKKAKEILAGIDAKLVSMGKIPQITYIFRAKNFFGMTDKAEVVLTPNQQTDNDYDADAIRRRYLPDASSSNSIESNE
jgi:hypothetical protein